MTMRLNRRGLVRPGLACLAAALLAACGAAGPLYLPDHPPPKPGLGRRSQNTTSAPAQPADGSAPASQQTPQPAQTSPPPATP
jgi:predicted small lipoprotein YifL